MLKNIAILISLFVAINLWLVFVLLGDNEKDAPKTTDLSVQEVTLYPQQARLSSKVNVSLKPGDTTLIFSKIAPQIDTASINVQADLPISKIQYRLRILADQTTATKLKSLQDSLVIFEDSLSQVSIETNALQKEEEMILANKTLPASQEPLTVDKLKEMASFFRTRTTEIQKERQKIDKKTQRLTKSLQKIKDSINQISQNPAQTSSEILIRLAPQAPFEGSLTISYLVNEAGWKPVYDFRVQNDTISALSFKAQVYQNSGINWQNVKLTFSTALPSNKPQLTTLEPWRVDLAQVETPVADSLLKKDSTLAKTIKPQIEAQAENRVEENELNASEPMEWTLAKANLNFGKNLQVLLIKTDTLKPSFGYGAMPKLSKNGFQTAILNNWKKMNLPKGWGKIYQKNNFIHETLLDSGEDTLLVIPLQARPSLKVARKLISKNQNTNQETLTEEWNYEIQLANNQKDTIDLKVEEVLPLPQHEKIKLNWTASDQAKLNEKNGILRWQIRLNPAETKTLNLRFSLAYPADRKVLFQ